MKVKIKKLHSKAVVPSYAKSGDAGMDLTAVSKSFDDYGNIVYGTGLAFEIPEGYVGLIFPRSSNSKKDLLLSNSVGVIDSGYRGEVTFKFKVSNLDYYGADVMYYKGIQDYKVGDRIGQIIILPYPKIEFIEVDELSETERGSGGYGSTGK
jgi:dUTP pyrophosphatase